MEEIKKLIMNKDSVAFEAGTKYKCVNVPKGLDGLFTKDNVYNCIEDEIGIHCLITDKNGKFPMTSPEIKDCCFEPVGNKNTRKNRRNNSFQSSENMIRKTRRKKDRDKIKCIKTINGNIIPINQIVMLRETGSVWTSIDNVDSNRFGHSISAKNVEKLMEYFEIV